MVLRESGISSRHGKRMKKYTKDDWADLARLRKRVLYLMRNDEGMKICLRDIIRQQLEFYYKHDRFPKSTSKTHQKRSYWSAK